jgi:RNA polymerase-binding protein DksA
MGAGEVVTGGLRRALKGVKGVLPGSAEEAPAAAVPDDDAARAKQSVVDAAPDPEPASSRAPVRKAPAKQAPTKRPATRATPRATPKAAAGDAAPATRAPAGAASAPKAAAPEPPAAEAPAGTAQNSSPEQEQAPSAPPIDQPVVPAWSPEELAGFRAALDAEVARLREELDMGEADLADLIADSGDGAGDDQADAGSKTFEREHEMSVNANTREMLDQALRALRRLEAGTYGMCESCGQPIAAGRLKAYPRATLCIPCKQAEERR